MGWKDKQDGETAAQLKARLITDGVCVHISEETGSVIVAVNGTDPLKQLQRVVVTEYVGLTRDAATLLVDLTNDATTTTVYYKKRASSPNNAKKYMAASTRSGTLTTVVATRRNDSEEWIARITETTYSAAGTGWSTTRPTDSTTGVEAGKTKRCICHAYGDGIGYKTQFITTTVTEYQFLTQAEAVELLSDATDTTTTTYIQYSKDGVWNKFYYTYGTVVNVSIRYIDETNGWTATKTSEVTAS